jgi:hypothetical protein
MVGVCQCTQQQRGVAALQQQRLQRGCQLQVGGVAGQQLQGGGWNLDEGHAAYGAG